MGAKVSSSSSKTGGGGGGSAGDHGDGSTRQLGAPPAGSAATAGFLSGVGTAGAGGGLPDDYNSVSAMQSKRQSHIKAEKSASPSAIQVCSRLVRGCIHDHYYVSPRLVGRGSSGTPIYSARSKVTGREVCVKFFHKAPLPSSLSSSLHINRRSVLIFE
ncbi:calcium-dependent protein kinase cdpk4a, partial [Cystoisospora suis]